MKLKLFAPMSTLFIVVAMLFVAACGDGPTDFDSKAKVRFFNAVWNAQDKIGFTTNTQFVPGSALAYLESTPTCLRLDAGSTSLGIGLANASGTALNSNTVATLDNQTITAGGNYLVLSGGNLIHPSVVLLDNNFSASLGNNQAAVRFVNLAAASEGPIDVSKGAAGSATTVQTNMGFRDATPFSVVTSGANEYTITYTGGDGDSHDPGNEVVTKTEPLLSGSDAIVTLQPGTINTIVISRLNPPDGKFTLVNLQPCS